MTRATTLTLLAVGGCVGCRATEPIGPGASRVSATRAVQGQLTRWHRAAAEGEFDKYFSGMTHDAVFLGTDPAERWTRDEFETFARPYFDGVEAWTYEQVETHITVKPDIDPSTAWVDEVLRNEKYGLCRGTGVFVHEPDGTWRIAHYSLTFLVPNEAAADVVGTIRASD